MEYRPEVEGRQSWRPASVATAREAAAAPRDGVLARASLLYLSLRGYITVPYLLSCRGGPFFKFVVYRFIVALCSRFPICLGDDKNAANYYVTQAKITATILITNTIIMTGAHTTQGPNGQAYILNHRAKSLANYPHARKVNGMIYVSGISSRKPDDTWEGVCIIIKKCCFSICNFELWLTNIYTLGRRASRRYF